MPSAAATLMAVQWRYARAGISLAQAALGGARDFVELRHYPSQDARDPASGTEFYYHAHGSHRRPGEEHGHFHVFKRFGPQDLQDRSLPTDGPNFVHVAALSLDARGLPIRWFCVNRWVTGERWLAAERLIECLPELRPRATGRLAPVGEWLNALLQLQRPAIAAMLRRRDRLMAPRLAAAAADTVLEDRRLDVITQSRIDLQSVLARQIPDLSPRPGPA